MINTWPRDDVNMAGGKYRALNLKYTHGVGFESAVLRLYHILFDIIR